MIFLKSVAIWLLFILAESVNGSMRIFWLVPIFGDTWGHQISFAIGSLLVVLIPALLIRWLNVSRITQLIQIGLLWVVLTAVFEICLGRFLLHYSWNQIAADYDVLHGGLMPFGFILLALSPLIAARLRGIFSGSNPSI